MRNFDFQDLSLEEVELIENLIGVAIDEAFEDGKPKGKALKVFVWVMTKRTNPNYTIEEASKLSLKQAFAMIKGEDEKKVE